MPDLPVYSAMEVMEEAVDPLSQSLSTVRLVLRLPGNDSTESQLKMVNDDVSVDRTASRRPKSSCSGSDHRSYIFSNNYKRHIICWDTVQ